MKTDDVLENFFLYVALKLGAPNFPERPIHAGKKAIYSSDAQLTYLQKFSEIAMEMGVPYMITPRQTREMMENYERWYWSNSAAAHG